ncbi:MAG: hypothetical protein ACO4CG_04655 [Prochlorothrix sp.]
MTDPALTTRLPMPHGDSPSHRGHSSRATSLQGFLQCLDVRLEDELHRYRRQKRQQQSQNAPRRSGTTHTAPLEILGLKRSQAAGLTAGSGGTQSFSPSMLIGGSTADRSFTPSVPSLQGLKSGGLRPGGVRPRAGQIGPRPGGATPPSETQPLGTHSSDPSHLAPQDADSARSTPPPDSAAASTLASAGVTVAPSSPAPAPPAPTPQPPAPQPPAPPVPALGAYRSGTAVLAPPETPVELSSPSVRPQSDAIEARGAIGVEPDPHPAPIEATVPSDLQAEQAAQMVQLFQEAFDFEAFSPFADEALSELIPVAKAEPETVQIGTLSTTAGFILPGAETVVSLGESSEEFSGKSPGKSSGESLENFPVEPTVNRVGAESRDTDGLQGDNLHGGVTADVLESDDFDALLSLLETDDLATTDPSAAAPSHTAGPDAAVLDPAVDPALDSILDQALDLSLDPWDAPGPAATETLAPDFPTDDAATLSRPPSDPVAALGAASDSDANAGSAPVAMAAPESALTIATAEALVNPADRDAMAEADPESPAASFPNPDSPSALTHNPTAVTATGDPAAPTVPSPALGGSPSGYLASSEALLESLPEDEDGPISPWLEGLLSPLGLGSLLLLLLASSTLGYVVMNPVVLNQWGIDRLVTWERPGSGSESDPDSREVDPSETDLGSLLNGGRTPGTGFGGNLTGDSARNPDGTTASPPSGPDLAAREFVDLGLDNLSNVEPQTAEGLNSPAGTGTGAPIDPRSANVPNPSSDGLLSGLKTTIDPTGEIATPPPSAPRSTPRATAATPAPTTPAPARSSPSTTANPAPQPPAAPTRPSQPPAAAPAIEAAPAPVSPAPPAPIAPATAANTGANFYVVTPYTSDRLLDQAQQAVPDAYLKNSDEGANIQFGVFDDRASAESLVQELQSQGIPAQLQE